MSSQVRSHSLPRAERRATILSGAAAAFANTGFEATSMEDIAALAGVTKLIVYRHFESKEALYRAVLEDASSRLATTIMKELENWSRGAVPRALLSAARQDPEGFRLLWRHSVREPKFAEYASYVHDQAAEFARDLLQDQYPPAFLPWVAVTMTDSLVAGVLNWLDYGDPQEDEQFIAMCTYVLWGGKVSTPQA